MNILPQNKGYNLFFTKENNNVVPMQYARASSNFNNYISDPMAINTIKNSYMPGPMHFGVNNFKKREDHMLFDIDLNTAYGTWLVNYKRGTFGYKVGGNKRYYKGYSYFGRKHKEGVRFFKLKFAVKTRGRENSRLYRRWLLKTTKVRNLWLSDYEITGYITIPDIEGLPQRFVDEVQAYEEHIIEIDSVIKSEGYNNVYINEKELSKAIRIKNSNNPLSKEYKMILNSSTGFLSIADKALYYTMINHIRAILFKLIDVIDKYNGDKVDDDKIKVVAANTDGITVYAHKNFEFILESLITYEVNAKIPFTFEIDKIYTLEEAHFTPNDIRKAVN